MAKVTLYSRLGKYGELDSFYNPNKIGLERAKDSIVIYNDSDGGEKIKIMGSDLSVNKLGLITAGTVTDVTFSSKNTSPLLKVEDVDIDAKTFVGILKKQGVEAAYEFALSGNDVITGSLISDSIYGGGGKDTIKAGAGVDHIEGGKGNDRLSGEAQSDHFIFGVGDGKDTITDFDAVGGALAQDYIDTDLTPLTIKQSGVNTIIDFGGGDTITLLGVKASDVGDSDFI
jgi:Ca2+-binding RTX toxin-like protein